MFWSRIRLVLLIALLAIFGKIVYQRGFGWHLGAAAASLESPYATEEAWIVGEIVRDLSEMSAYPAKPAGLPTVSPVAAESARYRVSINGSSSPVDLDLRQDLWSPTAFAGLVPSAGATRHSTSSDSPSVHVALVEPTPAALVQAGASVSAALATDMRNANAHEAAALTLASFALRESAGRFHDVRWSLNRMTAHLAMATALRGDAQPGIDGRLAQATLLTLTGHEQRAIETLDAIPTADRSSSVDAWTRALRLRLTQDWRSLDKSEDATLLEQQEYFRAQRVAVASLARAELNRLKVEPSAEWLRIVEASSMAVEDGWLMTNALDWERAEAAEVFEQIHHRDIEAESGVPLNARAGSCLESGKPDVLSWGAWAEFSQRHLAMYVGRVDSFYRRSLASPTTADSTKRFVEQELGSLSMFPLATIFWTKGPQGGEADLKYINEAIAAAVRAPERVTPPVWSFLEQATNYEPVRRGMPKHLTWYTRPAPRAAHDAATRIQNVRAPERQDFEAMLRDAPSDYGLASAFLRMTYADKAPFEKILEVYGPRIDYDVRAVRVATEHAPEGADKTRLLRTACRISAAECPSLAWALAQAHQDEEAAVEYERAFADPGADVVAVANYSGWLVNYYQRHGRTQDALALAERSNETGAEQGMLTAAALYERLGRWDDAERAYAEADTRYQHPAKLIGFYYRAVNVRKQSAYEAEWKRHLTRVFPDGLVPVATGSEHPVNGLIVTKDSLLSRKAGLQAGDIIVGLEGWRIENMNQYKAINAFFDKDEIRLSAWRGKVFDVTVTAPDRLLGIEFRTYPIKGWSE